MAAASSEAEALADDVDAGFGAVMTTRAKAGAGVNAAGVLGGAGVRRGGGGE